MKYLVVIVAGLTDRPIAEKDNKTPLQLAETPNLDALVQKGQCGPVQTIPETMNPGNEVSGLGLFGYDPEKFKPGHAALDAIGLGINMEADEIPLCCDLITLQATHDDMVMKDYTGGNLSKEDSELLMKALNEQVVDVSATFHSGKGYHNLLVIKHPPLKEKLSPPNELIGEGIRQFMPEGKGFRELIFVMNQAQIILHNHPYNQKRNKEQKDGVQKWHVHDCTFQMTYVLKGWATFEWEGAGVRTIREGDCINQIPMIKHRELAMSEDFEVLEIVAPADFKTHTVDGPD